MKTKKIIPYLSVLILLIGWELLALLVNQPELIPTTTDLLRALYGLLKMPGFYSSVLATLGRGLVGISISLVVAAGLATVFVRVRWSYELFRPILTIMRSVPVISFILLALIFLHTESIPLIIGFLTMFPLLTENLTKGIGGMDPQLSVMATQFKIGGWNRLWHIVYPQLKPFLYSGLASAAGFGWRAIIMGEVLSQCRWGVGSEMKRAQNFIEVPELIAWTLVAILISFFSDKVITRLSIIQPRIIFRQKKGSDSDLFISPRPQRIVLKEVTYRYAISDFSYVFEAGEIYGLSAPSGTGKTTLLNLVNGNYTPLSGTVEMDRQYGISSVFQTTGLLSHLTVCENLLLSLASLYTREEAVRRIEPVLTAFEIGLYGDVYPAELSYGQQQRVAIARALVYPSPYLLMDEPFRGLDEVLSRKVMDYIREQYLLFPRTILFTTHHSEELNRLATKILRLNHP